MENRSMEVRQLFKKLATAGLFTLQLLIWWFVWLAILMFTPLSWIAQIPPAVLAALPIASTLFALGVGLFSFDIAQHFGEKITEKKHRVKVSKF